MKRIKVADLKVGDDTLSYGVVTRRQKGSKGLRFTFDSNAIIIFRNLADVLVVQDAETL